MSPYDVICTDPPWLYYGSETKDQAAGKHYPCMTLEDLSAIPVPLSRRGVLFMWATGPKLDTSLALIKAWGMHYRGVAFVWVKTTQAGKIIHAQGVRPSIVKPTTEFVLAASYVAKGRPMQIASERMPQVILASRPGGIHSKKPADFYQKIEELYPSARRLEMFARSQRTGWDVWGNEV